MIPNSPRLKWILIVICPMFLAIIFLLRQKIGLQNLYELALKSESRIRQKDLVFIGPSTVKLNPSMSDDEADIAFFSFMSKRHLACDNSIRFGNALDGGWDMCIAKPYRPDQPCLVYSFGINNDFSFDDAISKKFNCTVRSFDPSMTSNDHQRSEKVWFYKVGIGGENTINAKKWTMKTLPTIIESFSETNKIIDYLKMDVEDSEWPSLVPMLTGDTLSRVKQFGVEIHFLKPDAKTLYDRYLLLNRLEEAGFRRWYFALNYYNILKSKTGIRSCCYEMVYINTRFLKTTNFETL